MRNLPKWDAAFQNNPMGSQLLLRRRLINTINISTDNVVYIYAPTGFGKTVLARQWAETQLEPIVWFDGFATSQVGDLFGSIVSEIRKNIPSLNKSLAQFENLKEVDDGVLSHFLQVIEKDKSKFHIVIDNAEVIRRDHNGFARFLVGKLPSHIKLILLTETSPRTSFLQEHGAGRFTIITPTDLNFTSDETEQLADQSGVVLSPSNLIEVQDLSQGWPLGVHIALSQLAVTKDFKSLISSIQNKGQDQFTVPAQRILASLAQEELEIVTQLSLLESIDAKTALTLTGNIDVVRILTLLSQDSMVVSQTNDSPPEFAIHPLLRKVLVSEYQRLDEFQVKSENLISYLLDSGRIREVTKILLQLGSMDKLMKIVQEPTVARNIDLSIQEAIYSSRTDHLRNWLDVYEHVPRTEEPAKRIIAFYIGILSGNFREAQSHLQALQVLSSDPSNVEVKGLQREILACESILAYASGDLSQCFEKAMECFDTPSEDDFKSRGSSITHMRLALWCAVIQDDDSKVKRISQALKSKSFTSVTLHHRTIIHSMHALIAAHEGRFIEAKNELAVPLESDGQKHKGFFASFGGYLAEFMIVSESGDDQKGLTLLQAALDQAIGAKNFPMVATLLGRMSYQQVLLGNTEEALLCIDQSREMITENDLSEELHQAVDIWEARVRYWVMDYKRADDLLSRSPNSYLMRAFRAGIYMSKGNNSKALEITETFDLQIPRQKLTYHLYRAHIFTDSSTGQFNEVRQAVEIGSKHGYFKHFLTQRSDVIQQYISLVAESPTPFNERLAKAAGERLNEMMVGSDDPTRSLTRREADILRHLGTGLPIGQIATDLCISKNTMKTHLRSIYRKLNATDRNDAVVKGKKLLKI